MSEPHIPEWMAHLATPTGRDEGTADLQPTPARDAEAGTAVTTESPATTDNDILAAAPRWPGSEGPDQHRGAIGLSRHASPPMAAFTAHPPARAMPRPPGSVLGGGVRPVPASGWRRAVYVLSGGTLNAGESPKDVADHDLNVRISAPVYADHRVAVLSLKGGAGKTTTVVGIGSAMAEVRNDRILGIDVNPDMGGLAHRVAPASHASATAGSTATIYDLIESGRHSKYADVRAHTVEADTGLQVLASHSDPARSDALTADQVQTALTMVADHYQVLLADCGTGITHPATSGVLQSADSVVVPTLLDEAAIHRAWFVLDWLDAHHMPDLAARAVVVVNQAPSGRDQRLTRVTDYFAQRVRAVVAVPADRHLAEGGPIYWDRLHHRTRHAYRSLAAAVADDFATKFATAAGQRL